MHYVNGFPGINDVIQLIKPQSCFHIEISQLICRANQLTGFYMMTTLGFNELNKEVASSEDGLETEIINYK